MALTTSRAMDLCIEAHARLVSRISGLTDEQARRPSLLPDWTVGHVLTYVARNADGHALRLSGALRGAEVARYPGGSRDRDIADGAGRPAEALIADVSASHARLEAVWRASEEAGWPHADLMAGDHWPTVDSPFRRLREVEIHHFDLGLGYTADEWPDEYAAWELEQALRNLPGRLDGGQTRRLLLWLIGRKGTPDLTLGAWS